MGRSLVSGPANKHKPALIGQTKFCQPEEAEVKEQRMMGRLLQVASDKPDLIPAAGHARVLVHGDHVVVSAVDVGDAENLPQQVDLTGHRLLRGRPKECPDSQSESRTSSTQTDTQTI